MYLNFYRGYTIPGVHRKFGQQRIGKFTIKRVVGPLAYELDLPHKSNIHPVVSIAQLEPAESHPDPYYKQFPDLEQPKAVEDDRNTEEAKYFQVEQLLKRRERTIGRN